LVSHLGQEMACARTWLLLLSLAFATLASAQLRPRRVGGAGVNARGQQEDVAIPSAQDDELAGLGGLTEQLSSGGGGFPDMAKMMESMLSDPSQMADNPLLKQLSQANPEIAKILNDPEMMKEKMAEFTQLMGSEDGSNMAAKMMEEMQSVMSDPEKLQQGLQQLAENPALKGLADAVPGLSEALSDPESMREQVEKTAEIFQKMKDPEQMQELLEQMGGTDAIKDGMAKMMEALGGEGGGDSNELLASMMKGLGGEAGGLEDALGGGGAESLKDRVDRLMHAHGMGEAAAELDEF